MSSEDQNKVAAGGEASSGIRSASPSPPTPVRHSKEGELHLIAGNSHDTVLYHGDDVHLIKPAVKEEEEEDESFYEVEVTFDDVKSMFRDLQRRRENLEDAPLKGQKIRALEKETTLLKSLHDHPNTAIRIRFPDRVIIQGIFRTSDTIDSVKNWLREHLHDPALEFYLFTAPPKKVLQDETKLVDEGLVAMVVIYFGSASMPDNNKVLKSDLYAKLSDPEQAFELAKSKLKVRKRESEGDDGDIRPSKETEAKDHSGEGSSRTHQPVRKPTSTGKIPKWFKMK